MHDIVMLFASGVVKNSKGDALNLRSKVEYIHKILVWYITIVIIVYNVHA